MLERVERSESPAADSDDSDGSDDAAGGAAGDPAADPFDDARDGSRGGSRGEASADARSDPQDGDRAHRHEASGPSPDPDSTPDPGPPSAPGPAAAPGTASGPDLAARLRALGPEASEVPPDALDALLAAHAARIAGLAAAFGLDAATLLTALGRGHEPGELDPSTAEAAAAGAAELGGLIASGSVTVRRDGRSTTLIAALTVGDALGPVRLADPYWEDRGLPDVWLCAVRPQGRATDTSRALLERILPQIGVLRANLRAVGDRELHIGLHAVDPAADPELVVARLEAWRSAVEQVGAPAIVWEQA